MNNLHTNNIIIIETKQHSYQLSLTHQKTGKKPILIGVLKMKLQESNSEFSYSFSTIMGSALTHQHETVLIASYIHTKLGVMVAIADETTLYLLEFVDKDNLAREVRRLELKKKAIIVSGMNEPINSIAHELKNYFEGTLKDFKTPVSLLGTSFQKLAWEELTRVPYGHTRSYMAQATSLGKNKAYRAVANANGANPLAIIIPCHRIIHNNGNLGGYGAGTERKEWLIEHEKCYV